MKLSLKILLNSNRNTILFDNYSKQFVLMGTRMCQGNTLACISMIQSSSFINSSKYNLYLMSIIKCYAIQTTYEEDSELVMHKIKQYIYIHIRKFIFTIVLVAAFHYKNGSRILSVYHRGYYRC